MNSLTSEVIPIACVWPGEDTANVKRKRPFDARYLWQRHLHSTFLRNQLICWTCFGENYFSKVLVYGIFSGCKHDLPEWVVLNVHCWCLLKICLEMPFCVFFASQVIWLVQHVLSLAWNSICGISPLCKQLGLYKWQPLKKTHSQCTAQYLSCTHSHLPNSHALITIVIVAVSRGDVISSRVIRKQESVFFTR